MSTVEVQHRMMRSIELLRLLKQHFGYDRFRPGQEEVITAVLEQGTALAVFPTGGGKSLCYQLPALVLDGVTLVVSPLIALMKDQIDTLRSHGIAAARLDSSLTAHEARAVADQVREGILKLLYVAPERFNNERFLALLNQSRIALFAVDEAHCISEWGHNFRPDYLKLAETAQRLKAPRVLSLTATATPSVVADICAAFGIPSNCAIVTGFYRPNLNLATTPTGAAERDALLRDRLRSRSPGPTIIYVTLQKTAERVATMVQNAGFEAQAYHAGMESDERARIQEWWMEGDARIVVATIAFGMGIDKADVRFVYHYNLAKSLESYSQEIGRAGRDGAKSTVEMLACPDDVTTLENFAYGDTPTESSLRALVLEILATGRGRGEFDFNLLELGNRHDLRPLVLRTALTYLEIRGLLRQGTPRYTQYKVKPLKPVAEIAAEFKGEPARLVGEIFDHAEKGRIWYTLNPDDLAAGLRQERRRIVRALEVLEERQLIELTASDVRNAYSLIDASAEPDQMLADLMERFQRRETQEIKRIQDVLSLITHRGCQTNMLVAYFGERRDSPCGHCTYCVSGKVRKLPAGKELPPIDSGVDVDVLRALLQAHPVALGEPRSIARFLCGLASPALTRAKLPRDPMFGSLADYPFAKVFEWCLMLSSLPNL